ncbi:MAG: hypothetical protein ACFE8A_06125 [Candidatus Hodarchaeota archaeon]
MDDDLREQINVAAYYLSQKYLPIDTLCNMLARRQLYIENNYRNAPEILVTKRTAEIFCSEPEPNYDVLCWLIAELDIRIGNKIFEEDLPPMFPAY